MNARDLPEAMEPADRERRALRLEGKHVAISGHVEPGFEAVADTFAENFVSRNELGAACSMYVDGAEVVDLWGGVRNRRTREPWQRDTMVIVWSATKGMSGLAIALAVSRGLLDYDERVCRYWPEFAQQGKDRITVRQLLSYQAGLFALDAPVDKRVIADLDRLAIILAQQKPEWAPGERQAYSMLSLGFYEGELLRRVDPLHRTLGQFFQDEIASPLGLDFYIRLPEEIPNSRLAQIEDVNPLQALLHLNRIPLRLLLTAINPRSPLRRSDRNPHSNVPLDPVHVYARNLEVPAGGGVGTARALARAYGSSRVGAGCSSEARARSACQAGAARSPTPTQRSEPDTPTSRTGWGPQAQIRGKWRYGRHSIERSNDNRRRRLSRAPFSHGRAGPIRRCWHDRHNL